MGRTVHRRNDSVPRNWVVYASWPSGKGAGTSARINVRSGLKTAMFLPAPMIVVKLEVIAVHPI
jgi:hypothetical protein